MPVRSDRGPLLGQSIGAPAIASANTNDVLGADGTWQRRAVRRLLTHAAYGAITNPTSATSLLGGASSNLWPTFVTTGDYVRVQGAGHYNPVSSATVTWTVLCGATTVGTIGPSAATTGSKGWSFDLWFKFDSSTSVRPYGIAFTRGSGTGYTSPVSGSADLFFGDGTPVTVTAAPQDFDLKAILSVGNASSTVTLESLDVWHYPV